MKAVMLEVDQRLLAERRSRGADRRDEMWEGVLHMVPPPLGDHQRINIEMMLILAPLAKARGLAPRIETGVFRPGVDDDYRVPDQLFTRPELLSRRGIDGGADLVVEILSPHDETDEKIPWYFDLGVIEVLVVDPSGDVELYRRGEAVVPDAQGELRSEVLDVAFAFATVDRDLRMRWDGGEATVTR